MQRFLCNWLAVWSLSVGLVCGQSARKPAPAIANVRVETTPEEVIVRYDVTGLSPKDSVFVQVEGQIRGLLNVRALSGDVGTGISVGIDKTIVWDFLSDGVKLDDAIRALVTIKPYVSSRPIGGGPANALLSALLPGLGNVMVQPNRRIRFQPVIAVAYIGALAYGLSQKSKSDEQYSLYLKQPYDRLATPYYNEANSLNHRYILAVGAAAVIWVADVTYTALKGMKNDQLRKRRMTGMYPTINYMAQVPVLGLRYQF